MSKNSTDGYRCALAIQRRHREVKWTGWRKLVQAAANNHTAYMDGFCVVCQTAFPCETYILASKIADVLLPDLDYPM